MTRKGGWPDTGFGERLKAIREQAGLSQKGLADRVGCTLEAISRLERGVVEPAWPLAIAISDALGVSCEAFRQTEPAAEPADKPGPGRPRKSSEAQAAVDPARLPPPGKRKKPPAANVQAPALDQDERKDAPPAALPPPQEKPKKRRPRKPRG